MLTLLRLCADIKVITPMNKSYSELVRIPTFKERYEYLRLSGKVGKETFGYDRYLNQTFYRSVEWKRVRDKVIIRDNGCDLGIQGYEIVGRILIHHINPITPDDIINRPEFCLDMNNLICTSENTHEAIHYSDSSLLLLEPIIRTPNDTIPWR